MNKMKTKIEKSKQEICEFGKRIWQMGMVAGNDGNISIKVDENLILITPTGVSKGFMTPEMIVLVDQNGKLIEGDLKPSSEVSMHLGIHRERKDVYAVVHTHAAFATSFAVAGNKLDKKILPEAIIFFGEVPVVEYGTTSTNELRDNVLKYINSHDALLLQNHGALTVGNNLENAYFKMEALEHYAKISLISELLGGAKELDNKRFAELMKIRKKSSVPGKHPFFDS